MTTKSSGTALKPYPICKESKNPWIGAVPEHWDVVPMSAVGKVKSVTGAPDLPLLSVYLRDGVILFSDAEERRTNPTSENLSNYQKVEPGDLVLNNQQAWRGSVGVSKYQGIVSPAYLVIALNNRLNQRFSDLLFRDRVMVDQYLVASKGVGSIQRNLYWPHCKRASALVPPLQEQAAIVRFLDHADDQIQRYIAAKERLITLLEEDRQALVHQAVTRGLDPNVRLKDSGVEWLGDVPEHWQTRRLRTVADMRVSNVDKHTNEDESPVRLCNYVDVYKNERITEDIPFMHASASPDEIERFRLIRNDVIITKDSETWDDIGVPALVEYSATDLVCGYHLAILRPTEIVHGPFLALALQSETVCRQFHVGAKGVTRYGLAQNAIQDALIPLPPLREQKVIAKQLDQDTKAIDATKKAAHQQIELMEEYRTRLIADVVTGQLDVREAAEELPTPEPTEITD